MFEQLEKVVSRVGDPYGNSWQRMLFSLCVCVCVCVLLIHAKRESSNPVTPERYWINRAENNIHSAAEEKLYVAAWLIPPAVTVRGADTTE